MCLEYYGGWQICIQNRNVHFNEFMAFGLLPSRQHLPFDSLHGQNRTDFL